MDTVASRLKWARREAGFDTATAAARAHRFTVSTYLGHENGNRAPSRGTAKRYGRAFNVRWDWLLEGEAAPSFEATAAPVLGYVGAGAEVNPIDDPAFRETFDQVELPPGAPPGTVAVIARGDSMYPRYFDGERLFYVNREHPPSELIGQECVVKLHDGRMLVKILRRGSRSGRFNLESWNAPLMEEQQVEWAAPVRWRG